MAFGEILRNARVQKGLTPSDVAENTHLLVQIVEDLEREDFRRVAAPIYGRGFVKLYAELLALDPEPLIREFMDLYAGARAPAVRTKKAEGPAEPRPEAVPVTRTVSGTVVALPQRQPVLPHPAVAVRPLRPSQTAEAGIEEAVREEVAKHAEFSTDHSKPARVEETPLQEQGRCGFVVEPEEGEVEDEEPDLFTPKPPPRRHAVACGIEQEPDEKKKPAAPRNVKSPVFKIGGRLEEKAAPVPQDVEAHERRRARIQAFVDGVTALKEGVERKLPSVLPQKRLIVLGGVGLAVLICMAVGIRVLFKLTGENVKEAPSPVFEVVSPPPDLYVD